MQRKNEEPNQKTSFFRDDQDSDSFSTEFFDKKSKRIVRDSESFDFERDANQSNNDAKYYFATGLGLCIASGFLFAFASPILATLVLIVAITLIGMSYSNSNLDICGLEGDGNLSSNTM